MYSEESINALKRSIESGEPGSGPRDLQIIPTSRCNAACVFCPLHAIPAKDMPPRFAEPGEELPGGLLDRLADDLYHLGGLERITITGGEPLIYRHFIPAVFQFGRSFPEAELTVVTNGILLRKFAGFIARIGIDNLTVSLNAGTAESYRKQNPGSGDAFEKIIEGLAELARRKREAGSEKPRVTLSAVLTKNSASDAPALFEIGRDAGVQAVAMIPLMLINIGGRPANESLAVDGGALASFHEDVAEYGARAKEHGFYLGYAGEAKDGGVIGDGGLYDEQPCYAGYHFAAVYPNGDVRPCCHCEPVMGNLKENSIIDIWRSERYAEQRRKMLEIRTGGYPEGCLCGECGYLYENRELHRRLSG